MSILEHAMIRAPLPNRPAKIIPLLALCLVVIVSFLALAMDGGRLYSERRNVQAGADAAALAAAAEIHQNFGTYQGLDPMGTAKASALTTAKANGFNNDGTNSIVTVNIPPLTGIHTGMAGYAEVIIRYNETRSFSNIFAAGPIPVKARAVACGAGASDIGILILDPSLSDACEIDGNVNILNGGKVYVNSDDPAGTKVANTSKLWCGGLNLVGGLDNQGSITYYNGGGLKTGVKPLADPLANIPEPTPAGMTNFGKVTIYSDKTLDPGVYTDLIINSGNVKLNPGIYYFDNGGSLQLNGGKLSGNGAMIFDGTGGDNILHPAKGPVNITPPSSGPYQGISFWIPRAQTKEVHIESTYDLTMPGTWYAQGGEYDIRPDGSNTTFNIGNYICDQAEWGQGFGGSGVNGKSNGIMNFNPATAAPTKKVALVE
jgi:hypothetical protein